MFCLISRVFSQTASTDLRRIVVVVPLYRNQELCIRRYVCFSEFIAEFHLDRTVNNDLASTTRSDLRFVVGVWHDACCASQHPSVQCHRQLYLCRSRIEDRADGRGCGTFWGR